MAEPRHEPGPEDVVEATPELGGKVAGLEVEPPPPAPPAPTPAEGWITPGIRFMVAGAFFFSVMSLLVKLAGQRLPTQQVVFVRSLIMLALCWWGARRAGIVLWGVDRRLLVTRGVVGYVGMSGFFYAVVHLPLADATVIHYTNPVFAALLAVHVLGERLHVRELAVLLASLAGVVLVMRPGFLPGFVAAEPLDAAAVGIGMVGAIGSAAAYVSVRKLRATEHPLVIVFYLALVAVIASTPLGLLRALWPTPLEWLVLLGVGVATHLGQVCITRGLHLERAGRATAAGYLQIVFAAAWGILFFGELLDLALVLGAALIVGSTLALSARPGLLRDRSRRR